MKKLIRIFAMLILIAIAALSFSACTKGDNGLTPHIGDNGNWFIGTTDTGIKANGGNGESGDEGDEGLSAYELYIKYYNDYEGTEEEWINDLINGNLARFNVAFSSNGGTNIESLLNVKKGTLINEPEDPEKAGYEFYGWYKDAGLSVQWDFDTNAITQDTTLYAKWVAPTQGLRFESINNGTEYAVTGRGTAVATDIVIPSMHNNLPVTHLYFYDIGLLDDYTTLTSITIPNSLLTIENDGLISCTGLTGIEVNKNNPNYSSQNGVLFNKAKTTLIHYPIAKTQTSYTIPEGVTNIGLKIFPFNAKLTSITIPDSATELLGSSFSCSGLTRIAVSESNPNYSSQNGILFNKNKTTLVRYPIGKTDSAYTVPDSVEVIGMWAFTNCDNLASVTISNNVTTIGAEAFSFCGRLSSIIIPDGVTFIGSWAFADCDNLISITIPNSVTEMEWNILAGSNSLQAIHIKGYTEKPDGWDDYWKNYCNVEPEWNCQCAD